MQGLLHSNIRYVSSVGAKCVVTANHTLTVIMLLVNVAEVAAYTQQVGVEIHSVTGTSVGCAMHVL